MSTIACPHCRGSGRVRDIDVVAKTQSVRDCDNCAGLGRVTSGSTAALFPPPRVRGTVRVLNPGDPGYDEARRRAEEEETSE